MAELNPDQWAEVEGLFQRAVELPPAERAAFLQRECPDQDLLRDVASLLEHAGGELASAGAAIASAAAALARETDPDERLIGTRLGPYRVEAIAGHGGMGAVYRASRDDAEFRQQVAIKLVRAAAESPSTLRRFRQERQILARLSHPNIARLLDGGSTPEGVPYLVMEFIEGESITTWCQRHSLTVEDRLRLFLRVCEGVDSAHRDRVVHRDLKPANILVTQDGTPKLLDFGIAKLLDPDAGNEAATLTGLLLMTPEYASPEQVRGEAASTAADVYSLGLILYELLTGKKAQPISTHTMDAVARVVCHMQPTAPALLNRQLAGDLDNIIRLAIRKEPERRYASAGVMARDIQCHLEGRPVTARPDTPAYRSAKFLRRNRIAVAAGLLIAASLAGGLVLESWLGLRQPRELRVVQLTQTGRILIESGVVTDGARVYLTEGSGANWSLAQVSVKGGTPLPISISPPLFQPEILGISPDRSMLLVAGQRGYGEDRPLWAIPTVGGSARRLGDVLGRAGAWSPDGKRIVFARGSALFRIDSDGTDSRKLLETGKQIGDCLRWGPAGGPDVLRLSMQDRDTGVGMLWEVAASGAGLHPLLRRWTYGAVWPDGEYSGNWTPSGKYYLFRSRRGNVSSLWALRENRAWLSLFDPRPVQIYSSPMEIHPLCPSPDGKQIFFPAGLERRELVLYDARRSQFVPFLPGIAGRWVDYSPDGRWVAYTTIPDDTLWISRTDGTGRVQLTSAPLRVFQARWSPDGTSIAFGGDRFAEPGKVYVMPVNRSGGGVPEAVTAAPFGGGDPSWSPDGNSLLFSRWLAGGVPAPFVMDRKTRKVESLPGSEGLARPAWSHNPRYIAATNTAGSQIRLFDFHTRRWTLLATGAGLSPPRWSHDGKYVYYQDVFAGEEQPIFRVRIADRKIERIVSSRQLMQSNVTFYGLSGLAPGDAPIATVVRRNADLYVLDVDLP
jgi:serine/threonine protein kinase/Tol biopolymer transport system component